MLIDVGGDLVGGSRVWLWVDAATDEELSAPRQIAWVDALTKSEVVVDARAASDYPEQVLEALRLTLRKVDIELGEPQRGLLAQRVRAAASALPHHERVRRFVLTHRDQVRGARERGRALGEDIVVLIDGGLPDSVKTHFTAIERPHAGVLVEPIGATYVAPVVRGLDAPSTKDVAHQISGPPPAGCFWILVVLDDDLALAAWELDSERGVPKGTPTDTL